MANYNFGLKIKSRQGLVYQGKVKSLSSVNEAGKFDILAQHANFISLIKDEVVISDLQGFKKIIKIKSGLLRMRENNLEIYLAI